MSIKKTSRENTELTKLNLYDSYGYSDEPPTICFEKFPCHKVRRDFRSTCFLLLSTTGPCLWYNFLLRHTTHFRVSTTWFRLGTDWGQLRTGWPACCADKLHQAKQAQSSIELECMRLMHNMMFLK